jgi:UDP-4-amino-4-deoxy-L-arabinose-oxoglutarate aminotransferase
MIAPYYHPEVIGSAPYCTDLAEWMADRTNVEVLTCRPRYPSADAFPDYIAGERDREIFNNVRITRVPVRARRNAGAVARLAADLNFLRSGVLAGIGKGLSGADVVIAFVPTLFSVALALIVQRGRGHLVVVVHDVESGLAKSLGLVKRRTLVRLIEAFERFLLNRAQQVIVLTSHMAEELRRNGVKTPITVLPIWAPSPDASSTGPAARVHGLTVMYSGALGRKQGTELLLRLSARLQAAHPHVKVVIRGDGSERAKLEKAARALGLSNLEFRELVPKEKLLQTLSEGDIHLVPQDARGANYAVPSKITTIMAAGRPFVCTANPDSALEHIVRRSEAGLCVAAEDEEGFFAGVAALLDDRARRERLGANGRRYATRWLSRKTILEQYERLILAAAAPPDLPDTAIAERAKGETPMVTGVPFYRHSLNAGYQEAVGAVLATPFLTSGGVGKSVEAQLCDYFSVPHASLVNSWTNGAVATLLALDIGRGDEVIVPAMTFIATANVAELVGAKPVFVDVDPETLLMTPSQVIAALTPRTRAVIPVHLYGQMCDVRALRAALAPRPDIAIIEDCAHSFEARFGADRPGRHSDAAIFSFYATKNVTCGEGGAIVTQRGDLFERIMQTRLHGMSAGAVDRFRHSTYQHWDMLRLGTKANLPDLLAALLPQQIETVEERRERREALALRYKIAFVDTPIDLPSMHPMAVSAHHLFPIHVPGSIRDQAMLALNARGVGTTVNYRAVPTLTYYRGKYDYRRGDFPISDEWGEGTLSLPLFPGMTEDEQDYVINAVVEAVLPLFEATPARELVA